MSTGFFVTEGQYQLLRESASVMHSIAATLTGEAKGDLSSLRDLLKRTEELPREVADALAEGVAEVRESLSLGDRSNPIGDANKLWSVFDAAWMWVQPSCAPPDSGLLKVADDLGYVLECVAEAYFGDATSALSSLCHDVESDLSIQFPDRHEVLAALRYADSCLVNSNHRREGVQVLCKTHRLIWKRLRETA